MQYSTKGRKNNYAMDFLFLAFALGKLVSFRQISFILRTVSIPHYWLNQFSENQLRFENRPLFTQTSCSHCEPKAWQSRFSCNA